MKQLSAGLFGLSISTVMISVLEHRSAETLAGPYNELAASVRNALSSRNSSLVLFFNYFYCHG